MADVLDIRAIEKMPREDFFKKIVRGFAKWEIFSRLVSLGPESLEDFEKSQLREEMVLTGISRDAIKTDIDLYGMARCIASRAVNAR